MVPLSILDLVRVTEETDARGALDNARDLASHAEGFAGDGFSCRPLRRSVGASVHFVASNRALESLSGRKGPESQLVMCKSRSVQECPKCDFGGLAAIRAGG
jgi:hypothetical protein